MLPWDKLATDNLDVAIEIFGRFDIDQNGAIDINELIKAIRHCWCARPCLLMESEFGKVDINRDGKITIKEFDEDAGRSIKEKLQQAVYQ